MYKFTFTSIYSKLLKVKQIIIAFIPLELLITYENLNNLDENQECNTESDRNQLDRTFVISIFQ